MFTTYAVKGQQNYLDSQKKYEIARTVLYFAISLSLFVAGILATKTRKNLLTVVAMLGCLPACKSMVGMIMFLKFKSLPEEACKKIKQSIGSLQGLYDMVFTSYDKTYQVDHLVLKDHTLCCYCSHEKTDENRCQEHLEKMLLQGGHKGLSIKVFKSLDKYTERLVSLNQLENDQEDFRQAVYETLKSISH